MSTLLYASRTNRRQASTKMMADPADAEPAPPDGSSKYVDALAALVPAEVLALHGVILTFTVKTNNPGADQAVKADGKTPTPTVEIIDQPALEIAFWALLGLGIVLYALARLTAKKWDSWDYVRMCIPALAFVGWTMLQKATAFDALGLGLEDARRNVIALFGAVALGALAGVLAYKVKPE